MSCRSSALKAVFLVLSVLVATITVLAVPSLGSETERVIVPTPPGGGPGISTLDADQAELDPERSWSDAPAHRRAKVPDLTRPAGRRGGNADPLPLHRSEGEAGGDDVYVFQNGSADEVDIEVAENGDLYLFGSFWPLRVFRSRDGGETWWVWGTIEVNGHEPSLHLAEGYPSRCFVAYRTTAGIWVAHARLGGETADFSSPVLVMPDSETDNFGDPDITSDAVSYDDYFVYLVGQANFSDEGDIWFARSTDQGDTWESHYRIASVTTNDRAYRNPQVAYGFGGHIHVAWNYEIYGGPWDKSIRYRRASLWANGGLSAWDSIRELTPLGDGTEEGPPWIGASPTDGQVVVVTSEDPNSGSDYTMVLGSSDSGAVWGWAPMPEDPVSYPEGIDRQSDGTWVIQSRQLGLPGIRRSNGTDFFSWGATEQMCDARPDSGWIDQSAMAVDPSTGQAAVTWIHGHDYGEHVLFDAEWRGGPGYPNFEDGFPLPLNATPVSPPAVVDLDGDADLEIVFGDDNHYLRAYHHDGSVVAGWPVEVGIPFSSGPVAIGDLGDDGSLHVLVGTVDGRALAYRTNGNLESGWPFQTGEGRPAFVSIGRFGGTRVAAVTAGDRLFFVDQQGDQPYGFSWIWPGREFGYPVAIGDVNGDGVQEAVGAIEELAFAVPATIPEPIFWRTMPANVSSQLSLGDLDLDGDAEILVPLVSGALFALQGDGSDHPGDWPFLTPSGSPLSSAALGNCLGGPAPEIAVASLLREVHLLYEDGDEQVGYPVDTDGWNIFGDPIFGYVADDASADVVLGARGDRGWAWSNFGEVLLGWPKDLGEHCYLAPAMGDLDLDGRAEIVFLTTASLVVIDVNQEPTPPSARWAMYGHDPARTGCANCPDPEPSSVTEGAEPGTPTRVELALPQPNPAIGAVTLTWSLPGRARVALEVFDVQGRRIATPLRAEVDAGEHSVTWDGLGLSGRPVADGRYFARLRAEGPGIREEIVRAITILR